jgi:hypothetical protein
VIVPHPAVGTDHVTAVLDAFATTAVNVMVPPATTLGLRGEIATVTGGTTVTVPCPLTAGAARLVALTWNVPADPGAVYWPLASTAPPAVSTTSHRTEVSAVPVTVAANWALPPGAIRVEAGLTATATD